MSTPENSSKNNRIEGSILTREDLAKINTAVQGYIAYIQRGTKENIVEIVEEEKKEESILEHIEHLEAVRHLQIDEKKLEDRDDQEHVHEPHSQGIEKMGSSLEMQDQDGSTTNIVEGQRELIAKNETNMTREHADIALLNYQKIVKEMNPSFFAFEHIFPEKEQEYFFSLPKEKFDEILVKRAKKEYKNYMPPQTTDALLVQLKYCDYTRKFLENIYTC